jgi:hypothetical protein
MKKNILISLCLLFFYSCGPNKINVKNEKENSSISSSNDDDSLMLMNKKLAQTINEKDSTITSILETFNSIQLNLLEIQRKQTEIRIPVEGENKANTKKRLISQIKSIEDLNKQNKEKVIFLKQSLKEKNSSSTTNYDYFLQNLDVVIFKNDSQITEMINMIHKNNYKIEYLEKRYFETKQELEEKDLKLKTAYYTAGTAKQLLKKGVITKQGGVIGLGKTQKLSENFKNENFQEVNISKLKQIKLSAHQIKLVTTHPANSFSISNVNDNCILSILNSDKFWSASKYMVILIEKE